MGNNKADEKKKRADNEEKEERIKCVQDLIVQGYERSEIVKKLQENFDIKTTQAYEYFKIAQDRFTENLSVNLLGKLNISLHTRMLLKRMAFETKQIELAHKIQIEMDKFLGLDLIAPQISLNIDFIQFFQEELVRILTRNNAIVDQEERLNRIFQDIRQASSQIARQVSLIGSGEDTDTREDSEGETGETETGEPFSIL